MLKVEDGNIEEMANLLSESIKDTNKRELMANKSQQEIKKYMPDVIADKWDQLFDYLKNQ